MDDASNNIETADTSCSADPNLKQIDIEKVAPIVSSDVPIDNAVHSSNDIFSISLSSDDDNMENIASTDPLPPQASTATSAMATGLKAVQTNTSKTLLEPSRLPSQLPVRKIP